MSVRLGELLIEKRRITPAQLEEALAYKEAHGGDLGGALANLGFVPADEIAALRGAQYGVRSIDLSGFEIEPGVLELIPAHTARKHRIVPLRRSGATLTVVVADPRNVAALDDVRFRTGCAVEPLVASEAAVAAAIARYYDGRPDALEAGGQRTLDVRVREIEDLPGDPDDLQAVDDTQEIDLDAGEEARGQAPVVRLVNAILASAVQRGASDVHVEPYEKEFRIRLRIDGVLHQVLTPSLRMRDAVTSRLKVMAKLDIAERRVPQDGRVRLRFRDGGSTKAIDLRVSCLPTLFGEKIVLRLLDKTQLMLDMTKLGFEEAPLRRFTANIHRPWGMVLATGPTGSGKTNTLYSSIARLNTPDTNIVTAEDPVEFNLNGVNQVQIREGIGLSFAAALRAFLRQDPNVILVGEIRDVETAEIAVKAALTGHLVLSTLHTNDAPSAVSRLLNMGIEPFLIAGSVNLICAQRLVRRVCRACTAPAAASPAALVDIGFSEAEARAVTPRQGSGCDACNGTGYKGRIGLYEVLEVTEPLRERILAGGASRALRRAAIDEGMLTLRQSVAAGEAGGVLDAILERLAVHVEKHVALRGQVRSAMMYPVAVLTIAAVVVGVILWKVIPTFAALFEGFGAVLPLPTRLVIAASDSFVTAVPLLGFGALGATLVFRRYYSTGGGRLAVDGIVLRLPAIGGIVRKNAVARFCRTLSALLGAGVPILESLEITAGTAGNAVVEDAVMTTRAAIERGESVAAPLRDTRVFPVLVTQMINVGETTGALDTMLARVADFYEAEVDRAVAGMTALLEPVTVAVLGVVVGGIVVAMYLPVFDLIGRLAG